MKLSEVLNKSNNKVIYIEDEMIIKLFDEKYSKSDVLNEALNLARVEETGINVPIIKEVKNIDGKWAIAYGYIDGKTLDELIKENPEKEEEYLDLFINLQIEIQSKKCPLLASIKTKLERKINASDITAVEKYDLIKRLDFTPNHNKLCHGDFNPENIVITDDGKAYILDWSHVFQGNSSADVAQTYIYFVLKESKEKAEHYLDLFCQKSQIDINYIRKWIPVMAAAQSVKKEGKEKETLILIAKEIY